MFSQKRKETTANTAKMSVQAQHADTVPPASVTRRSVQRFRPRHHAKRAVSSGKTARFGLRYVPSQNAARLVWQCHEAVFLPFSAPFQARTRGYIAKGKGRIAPPEGIRTLFRGVFPHIFRGRTRRKRTAISLQLLTIMKIRRSSALRITPAALSQHFIFATTDCTD